MRHGRYWLTRTAENDLVEIVRYTLETWGPDQLDVYRQRLETRLASLVQFPELGRSHPMLRGDFRYIVEGRHYLFYRIAGGDIEVLRFLHCQCDLAEKLAAYL